jgi:hypothetical protein
MLVAASIACVFLISAINILTLSGKFFEISDFQALRTERSLIYYETFTKMASKHFIPKQYVPRTSQTPGAKLIFQTIDAPKFAGLGNPNVWIPSEIDLGLLSSGVNNEMFVMGYHIWYGADVDPKTHMPLNIVLPSFKKFSLEGKNVYLKPVYVNGYKYRQDKGSGWDKGNFLPFDQKTFDELIREKKNGNVSRIYLVVK